MSWGFSDGFLRVANSLGIDAYKEREQKYLEYARKKKFRTSRKLYNTGRGSWLEPPQNVFKYYNDGVTRPSKETLYGASLFFNDLTRKCSSDAEKVKLVAGWVNATTDYVFDKDNPKYRSLEYWSSPFDLWAEYRSTGRMSDDCDGSAVMILWGCVLAGVPADSLYVWAGWAQARTVEGGHCNVVFFDEDSGSAYHVEGSFYGGLNQRNWGAYFLGHSWYPETWFLFNASDSFVLR
jgi:hypothetical protein